MTFIKYISTIILVFTWGVAIAQLSLEYKLNVGDTFKINQSAEQIITQELDGATHILTNDLSGTLNFKVTKIIAENYIIEFAFEDLNLTMTSNLQGELMKIKAKEVKDDDVQSKIFNSILNNPILMTLSKNGDILKTENGDAIIDKMITASGIKDEIQLTAMRTGLEKEFGSKTMADNFKQMTFFYPNNKVNINDTWQNEHHGKVYAKNIWMLSTYKDASATIIGKSDITMTVEELASTMNLTGTQDTTIETNITTGILKTMSVKNNLKGTSSIAQLGTQQIPTTIQSTITYTLNTK